MMTFQDQRLSGGFYGVGRVLHKLPQPRKKHAMSWRHRFSSGTMEFMSADDFRPVGDHSVRIEGDIIFLRIKGVVKVEDMMQFLRLQAQVKRERGLAFVLYDSRENTGLDPAARKYATDHAESDSRVDAAASFGAPFGMRVLVNMLNRALTMLRKDGALVQLFDTEAQARQYLEAERARLRSAAAA